METKDIKPQVSEGFLKSIKEYLDKRAATDEQFAISYAKQTKSLIECCHYILNEVMESGRKGFADDEIYGMAVHYYDEDNIKDVKPIDGRVVVNHTIELTDEEKAEAHREAIRQEVEAERKRLEDIKKAKQEKQEKHQKEQPEEKHQQLSLFE